MKLIAMVMVLASCEPPLKEIPATTTRDPRWDEHERRAEIGRQLKQAPAATLLDLGLSYDDFEPIAKTLYQQWRATHPQVAKLLDEDQARKTQHDSVEAGAAHWWCAAPTIGGSSSCFRQRKACNSLRVQLVNAGTPMGACAPAMSAICYVYFSKLSNIDVENCSASFADCRALHDVLAVNHQGDVANIRECNGRD